MTCFLQKTKGFLNGSPFLLLAYNKKRPLALFTYPCGSVTDEPRVLARIRIIVNTAIIINIPITPQSICCLPSSRLSVLSGFAIKSTRPYKKYTSAIANTRTMSGLINALFIFLSSVSTVSAYATVPKIRNMILVYVWKFG